MLIAKHLEALRFAAELAQLPVIESSARFEGRRDELAAVQESRPNDQPAGRERAVLADGHEL